MTTRHRPEGSPRAQEAYASSREFAAGILGNLARKNIGGVMDAEVRGILWWLQGKSWGDGGLKAFAQAMIASCPAQEATRLPQKLTPRGEWETHDTWIRSLDGGSSKPNPYGEGPTEEPDAERIEGLLREFCTNPAALRANGRTSWWERFVPILQRMRVAEIDKARKCIAETTLAKRVWESLEQVLASRVNALLCGPPLIGKGTAATAWCRSVGGVARLVETPVGNDVGSLVKAVARSLGTASATSFKTPQVEERVMSTLLGSDLVLVFNHAERLWPAGDIRQSHPVRIEWLLALMDDPRGIPVALVADRKWVEPMAHFRGSAEYIVRRFEGLLSVIEPLPDSLTEEDLAKIVEVHCPSASKAACKALVQFAGYSARGLAGMMSAIHLAAEIAAKNGRSTPTGQDFEAALRTSARAEAGLARLHEDEVTRSASKPRRSSLVRQSAPVPSPSDAGVALMRSRQADDSLPKEPAQRAITTELNTPHGGSRLDLGGDKISPEPIEGPEVFIGQAGES